MNAEELKAHLKQVAHDLGFQNAGVASVTEPFSGYEHYLNWLKEGRHAGMDYLVRHAQLRESAMHLLPRARTAFVVTQNYAQPLLEAPDRIRVARYAQHRDYHNVLRRRLKRWVSRAQSFAPDAEFRICVDSAPLLERELAHRAGLGWFGKNTMLIDSRRGSWFLIATVLTTLDLPPDAPSPGGCGTCTACIDACPTGAIVHADGRWQVDARQCLSYWTIEHRGDLPDSIAEKLNGWTFGCDICQEVCPFNQPRPSQPMRAEATTDAEFLPVRPWPTYHEVVEMSEPEWDALSLGSPVRRAGLDGLRRTVRAHQQSRRSANS